MTLARMRHEHPNEISGSEMDRSESTYDIVEGTYKEMEDFDRRMKPRPEHRGIIPPQY